MFSLQELFESIFMIDKTAQNHTLHVQICPGTEIYLIVFISLFI